MLETAKPYLDLAKDAGLALTDANYAYALMVSAATLLTIAGLLVLVGLVATHGKSHGTRFSAMAVFGFAAVAGAAAWLLRPDTAAGTMLGELLPWCWAPPALAGLALFATLPKEPMPRTIGLGASLLIALGATLFGGMLSIANERAMNPDAMTWLDSVPGESARSNPGEAAATEPSAKVEDTQAAAQQ